MKNEPDRILGGKLVDYILRVEFQQRGSPHVHCLLWIEDAPKFDTAEGRSLIDEVVHCTNPDTADDEELSKIVSRCQIHKCTRTCYKNNKSANKKCRFGFPMPVSDETRILDEEEIKKFNGRLCLKQRSETEKNINVYNPTILKIWGANMDIQPVGGMYGIAYYIAKDCSKEEHAAFNKELSESLFSFKKAIDTTFLHKVSKAARLIMTQRERSAQEAAYIVACLPLTESTRNVVFLNSHKPDKRTRLLRTECMANEIVTDDYFCPDLNHKYSVRPAELEELCVARIATEYLI